MKKQVAIIGAGPAGLVAAKSCLEYGLTPTIFEKSSRVGGVWSGEDHGAAWTGMHTNLSKWSCMFSDFPWSDDTQEFPFQSEVANYLQNYADAFHVSPHIRFNAEVIQVSKTDSGWKINFNNQSENFDAVIVASGFFTKGAQPVISGQENFVGDIIHSSQARPDQISKSKKIIICGGSFSGYELATEFAKVSEVPVTHVFNRPSWVLKRYFPNGTGASLPVDLASYSRKINPADSELSPQQKTARSIGFFKSAFGDPAKFHADLTLSEDVTQPQFVVISNDYLEMVGQGNIVPLRGNVQHFNQQSVCMKGSQEIAADTFVWATGYRASLPFIGEDIKLKIDYREDDQFMPALLHEAVWPKEEEGLAFVGFYRGPYFAVMELQARWVAGVFAGDIKMPQPDEIENGILEAERLRNLDPRPQFPYGNYVEVADRLARKVGCYPDLQRNDKLYAHVNEGFFLPSHYRLVGHASNRAVVEKVIEQIPYIK